MHRFPHQQVAKVAQAFGHFHQRGLAFLPGISIGGDGEVVVAKHSTTAAHFGQGVRRIVGQCKTTCVDLGRFLVRKALLDIGEEGF